MTNKRTETHPCDYDRKETHGDVIYRQDAIDAMYKIVEQDLDSSVFEDDLAENPHIDVIVDELENLPSAEPEIVYCKDCKHMVINESHEDKPMVCCKIRMCGTVTADDFCSWAERRTDA